MVVKQSAPRNLGRSANTTSKFDPRLFGLVVFGLVVASLVASLFRPEYTERVVFAVLLLFVCAAPAMLGFRPKYRVLTIYLGWYFVCYGLSDLLLAFFDPSATTLAFLLSFQSSDFGFNKGDVVIFCGAIAFLAGYTFVSFVRRDHPVFLRRDYAHSRYLPFVFSLWSVGFIFQTAYALQVTPANIPSHILGLPLWIASNIKQLSFVGAVCIFYIAMTSHAQKKMWPIVFFIIFLEFTVGFLANTRELSFRLPITFLMMRFLLQGTLSTKLLVILAIGYIPYGIYWGVYRSDVLGRNGMTPIEAVAQISASQERLRSGATDQDDPVTTAINRLRDRINLRPYVDIFVANVGVRNEYMDGETIAYALYTFIPRLLWPDKPEINLGQRFNNEFGLSASDLTFVPVTHLGELYWNYGVFGVIVGMLTIGVFLGMISNFVAAQPATLPRVAICVFACYFLIIRFEAGLGSQFGVFGRAAFWTVFVYFLLGLGASTRRRFAKQLG